MKGDRRPVLECLEDPITQQHFKNECDINRIVARFQSTGVITHLAKAKPQYGFASSQSFSEAAFNVAAARSQFEELPSNIRAHFNNDAAEFFDAAADQERYDEFVTLGLIEKPPEEPKEPAPQPLPTDEVALDEPSLVQPPAPASTDAEKGAN